MKHIVMHRTESNSVLSHALYDWLLGRFELPGSPLNRVVIADCPSFGQGWVGGGAWSCVAVSTLLFYNTRIIAAGAHVRDSTFVKKGL